MLPSFFNNFRLIHPILVHCVTASTLVQQQTVDEEIWKLAPQKRDALGW